MPDGGAESGTHSPMTSICRSVPSNCNACSSASSGRPELALAQALQFEGTLRQIDVIGEWVPDSAPPSGIRWANGLLWQHFRDYVLMKDTTKTGQEANIDFTLYPLAL